MCWHNSRKANYRNIRKIHKYKQHTETNRKKLNNAIITVTEKQRSEEARKGARLIIEANGVRHACFHVGILNHFDETMLQTHKNPDV